MIETAFLFLGSVIGAGFATGAEIATFFGNLQLPTWIITSMVGLIMFSMIVLEINLFNSKQALSSEQGTNDKLLHIVFIMIYLILFTAMTAGTVQITNYQFGLISLTISAIIVLFGFNKMSHINFYIVLIIIFSIITTTLPLIIDQKPSLNPISKFSDITPAIVHSLLYAGLNCFAFPELIIVSTQKHSQKKLIHAGAITTIVVTILVGLILNAIRTTKAQMSLIPLLVISHHPITLIIIQLAILSSQYTTLFAITQRLHKIAPKTKDRPILTITCLCMIALIGSFCGFNRIIQYGYPLIGAFICFYLLFFSLWQFWHYRRR